MDETYLRRTHIGFDSESEGRTNHEIIPGVTNAPDQNCSKCHGAAKTKQVSFHLVSNAFERHSMLKSKRR